MCSACNLTSLLFNDTTIAGWMSTISEATHVHVDADKHSIYRSTVSGSTVSIALSLFSSHLTPPPPLSLISRSFSHVLTSSPVIPSLPCRYNTRISGGDIFHILDFNMRMFLGGSDSTDSTHSIFNTEGPGPGQGQTQGQTPGSQHLGGIADKVYARIDNDRGLFVLHPDLLISPTKIAEAIGCVRRGVISERVKSLGGFNKAAVLGNLRHSFIEVRAISNNAVAIAIISITVHTIATDVVALPAAVATAVATAVAIAIAVSDCIASDEYEQNIMW